MREPDFEPFSWFETHFRSGSTKKACCLIHLVSRFCFLTFGKVHIAKMKRFFKNSTSLSFALCFLPFAARSLKRTKNTEGSKLVFFFFETLWPILRLREVEISIRDMCHKTAGFTTCCLSLWCRRCLWRVSSSRSCCDKFGILKLKKEIEICGFSHQISILPFLFDNFMKNEIRMPECREKKEVDI